MAKNILEDIKPLSRKSRPVHEVPVVNRPPRATPPPVELPFEPVEPRQSPRYGLWYIAVICIIGFLFSLSFLFEHATVTITPKAVPVSFDTTDTFTAEKDGTDPDTIVYTVMTLSNDESLKLPGTQSKTTSASAVGTVTLYNEYQATSYKLVKNTRLATPDGRIYRITSAVSIPGYTKANGTVVAGTIDVGVVAAASGDAYNLDQGTFTLPGLASTPQYAKIYAKTKTPIAGGISGLVYSVSQDVANAALGTLQDKLKASLIAKAKVQVPDGYLFYNDATSFSIDDSVAVPVSKDPEIPLALHGTLTAYLIKEDTLVKAIAEKSVSQYNGEPVTVPEIASLSLVPTADLQPDTDTSFSFSLSGDAHIVWTIDPSDVKNLLAGKKKSDFQSLLGTLVGVDRADVTMKPFWKQSFPDDPTRISVVLAKP